MGSNSGSRIEFNGEESTIKSANYKKELSGMLIDLDDGIMSMSSLNGSIILNT
jgi:hypothetical protein